MLALAAALMLEATGQFRVPIPEGFTAAEETPPPLLALLARPVWEGQASLSIELHELRGGVTVRSFAKNLAGEDGFPRAGVRRKAGGRSFEVYDKILVESFRRRLSPEDPYRDALGATPGPPRLSFLESARFQISGDAYKLYRCRKRGEWRLLRGYRKARREAHALAEFLGGLDSAERRAVSTCFGQAILGAMERGDALPAIPKPSMYRLRILARDELMNGAAREVEWESVYLVESPAGLYALRYRAPPYAFDEFYPAFLSFIAGFKPLSPENSRPR